MNKDEFDKYLNNIKGATNTISLLNGKYFYNHSLDLSNLLMSLEKKIFELDP